MSDAQALCWRPFENAPAPSGGELHVWRLRVDRGAAAALPVRDLLSAAERERAARFHLERDAVCFTLCRARLRLLLGRAIGVDAAAVRFEYGAAGQPLLAGGSGPCFSVSHSGAFALIAISAGGRVGVDLERIRSRADCDVAAYFSEDEVRRLRSLPPDDRERAFFRCWTRKEAYLKARGDGLGFGLQRFAVTLGPAEPPRLLWVRGEPGEARRWDLRDLPVDPAYSAAIIAEAPVARTFRWDIEAPR